MKHKYIIAVVVSASVTFLIGDTDAGVKAVAIEEFDVVSYHFGSPLKCSGEHVLIYAGAKYLVASRKNKKALERDPVKYMPAYGGYCATGAALGKKLPGDPNTLKIVDSSLYLNANADISKTWQRDIPCNINKAAKNWWIISTVAALDLNEPFSFVDWCIANRI